MGLKPGMTNNLNGRPKGSPNKTHNELRERIGLFLTDNWERIETDFQDLDPEKRIALFEKLLQYALPRMQAMQLQTDYEKLTDAQLDDIIDKLKSPPL